MQKHLKAEYQVLSVLASEDSPIGFNELQEKASVSSRTVAEHLKNFIPTIVQRIGRKYFITNAGRQRVAIIERDLEKWRKKGAACRFPVETVEVYSIGPKCYCKGTVKVTCPRRLLPKERGNLDEAITQTIKTFSSIVPQESSNWRISIYSHISSKP